MSYNKFNLNLVCKTKTVVLKYDTGNGGIGIHTSIIQIYVTLYLRT